MPCRDALMYCIASGGAADMPWYRIVFRDGTSRMIEADTETDARRIARGNGANLEGAHVQRGSVRTEGSVRGFHVGPDPSDPVNKVVRPDAQRVPRRWRVTFRDGSSVVVIAPNQSTAIHKAGADKRAQSHARRDIPLVGPTANDAARHEGAKVAKVDPV